MNREQFIREHVRTCAAQRCKKYDPNKRRVSLHSLAYSRRKCAKGIWRQMQRAAKGASRKEAA